METPISIETVVLFGSASDPVLQETAKKLEEQGRIVEFSSGVFLSGKLCFCSDVVVWPHSHKPSQPC